MKRLILACFVLASCPAWAHQHDVLSQQPINIVVGYAPGGSTDTVARIIGKALSDNLNHAVIVTNKPGASGTIAASEVARAKPGSNMFLMFTTPMLLAKYVYKDVRVDIKQDLAPISMIYDLPNVLTVNHDRNPEIKNLQDLVDYAHKQPHGVTFGSGGSGSIGQLSVEDLKTKLGFKAEHIPYKGGAPAVMDLLGGQIDMVNADMIAVLPHIRSGKLHAVAIGSVRRLDALPDTPTVAEQGVPGFTALAWGALLGPKTTPTPVVELLNKSIAEVLNDENVRQQLLNAGAIVAPGGPAETTKRLSEDDERWGGVAKATGISPN